jgi:hypothetical protein
MTQPRPEESRVSRRAVLIGAVAGVGGLAAVGELATRGRATAASRPVVHKPVRHQASSQGAACEPTGFVQPVLSSSAGAVGSTFAVSGDVPVQEQDGTVFQPTLTDIAVWWNLSSDEWYSALGNSPVPAQPGLVAQIGQQQLTTECSWSVDVTVPAVPAGDYVVEVLYSGSGGDSWSSFQPVTFTVSG